MAPAAHPPTEVDVFTGPHSRMKRLVKCYSAKLSAMDFSSYIDLKLLLCNLIATFNEFKTHESIENDCIMHKLKNRLTSLQVEVKEVSKVHSNNKLSEMLELFEEDCQAMNHCQLAPREMQTIGKALCEALTEFNQEFLPHMQEEEEIFQPLLMEYFTHEELKAIKSDVIQRHLLLTKYNGVDEKDDSGVEIKDKQEEDEEELVKILSLPTELTLEILSYLGPRDLLRCAQVCSPWANLTRDGSLWKTLHPILWAKGDWQFHKISDISCEVDPQINEEDMYVVVDEDADFDETLSSGESDADDTSQSDVAMGIRREAKMLDDMSKYLIPYIGGGVENIVLAQSKGLTNAVVYRILVKCPNLKHFDLSMTIVSDIAFKGLGKNRAGSQLKHVDISGCTSITDLTLKQLSKALSERFQDTVPNRSTLDKNGRLKTNHGSCGSSCSQVMDKSRRGSNLEGAKWKAPNNDRTNLGPQFHPHDDYSDSKSSFRLSTAKTECCYGIDTQRLAPWCHSNTDSSSIKSDYHIQTYRTEIACGDQSRHSDALRTSCYSNPSSSWHPEVDTDGNALRKNAVTMERSLEYLSLSGCYKITDRGLRYLAEVGLANLHHLDLSGCLGVTAAGISQLAYASPLLDHEKFFYCDNILEGPYADTASGCQNLACSSRVCCRGGE